MVHGTGAMYNIDELWKYYAKGKKGRRIYRKVNLSLPGSGARAEWGMTANGMVFLYGVIKVS